MYIFSLLFSVMQEMIQRLDEFSFCSGLWYLIVRYCMKYFLDHSLSFKFTERNSNRIYVWRWRVGHFDSKYVVGVMACGVSIGGLLFNVHAARDLVGRSPQLRSSAG